MNEAYPVSVAVFLAALAAAGGVGRGALEILRAAPAGRLERWVFGAAVGLGLLSYAVLAVGLAGWLRPPVLWSVLALFALAAIPGYVRLKTGGAGGQPALSGTGSPVRKTREGQGTIPGGSESQRVQADRLPHRLETAIPAALYLYGAGLAALTFVGALAPPVDLDWDSLVYHLAAPKIYLAHARIHFIEYDSHTNFPFTLQMLYTLGLATGGVATAKLFHWAAGWLTAVAVGLLTRRIAGERAPLWAPPLAAVLFASVPQVAWEATTAYIDLGTALYQFLALVVFVEGVQVFRCSGLQVFGRSGVQAGATAAQAGHDAAPAVLEGRDDPVGSVPGAPGPPCRRCPLNARTPERLFLLSGLLSGWAMGTKMTAVVPFALLAGWAAWLGLRSRERTLLRAGAWFVLAGVAVASPWYVKSYLWTNNPVYPFFYHLFPRSVNWNEAADRAYRAEQRFFGRGHDLPALLYLPWDTAMRGADYFNVLFKTLPSGDRRRQLGDILGGVSATFLALLPLALFLDRWDRRLTWFLVYCGLMVLVWFFMTQQTRYLLPVLAPLSVVAALVVSGLRRPVVQRTAALFVALTLLLHAMQAYATTAPALDVVTGSVSRRDYLARHQPDLFPALEFVNALPPESRVAFFQEVRGFYCDRDYFWVNPGQNTIVPYDDLDDGRALASFLRERLGLTHALVNHQFDQDVRDQRWYQLMSDAIARRALVPIFATTSPRTGRTLVAVYRIEPP